MGSLKPDGGGPAGVALGIGDVEKCAVDAVATGRKASVEVMGLVLRDASIVKDFVDAITALEKKLRRESKTMKAWRR